MQIKTNTGDNFILVNYEENFIIGVSTKFYLKTLENVEKV